MVTSIRKLSRRIDALLLGLGPRVLRNVTGLHQLGVIVRTTRRKRSGLTVPVYFAVETVPSRDEIAPLIQQVPLDLAPALGRHALHTRQSRLSPRVDRVDQRPGTLGLQYRIQPVAVRPIPLYK
ncbi:hypothetical protein BTK96_006203 [Burkholderia pyrrocinia]|uniref:hypothetical protein n=1 Tax=Burkholderia sp. IT-111MI5 TaxID=3026439 RepID=UPI002A346AA7|nr:hypothetical protein [Burkholderia pyrrocinia]EKS9898087.1 hypothetical protein [Burkholderia pyrrocinia]EKS9909799.1 hypothetical protein [Burkholderia pyrrocinia]